MKKRAFFVRPVPKTFTLRVRMTPDEALWLRDLSKEAGVTASQFVRVLLQHAHEGKRA